MSMVCSRYGRFLVTPLIYGSHLPLPFGLKHTIRRQEHRQHPVQPAEQRSPRPIWSRQ